MKHFEQLALTPRLRQALSVPERTGKPHIFKYRNKWGWTGPKNSIVADDHIVALMMYIRKMNRV